MYQNHLNYFNSGFCLLWSSFRVSIFHSQNQLICMHWVTRDWRHYLYRLLSIDCFPGWCGVCAQIYLWWGRCFIGRGDQRAARQRWVCAQVSLCATGTHSLLTRRASPMSKMFYLKAFSKRFLWGFAKKKSLNFICLKVKNCRIQKQIPA